MKRTVKLALFLLPCLCAFALFGCAKKPIILTDGDYVVITVDAHRVSDDATLKDYMDFLQSNNELSFTMSDGMMISINGKKGGLNEYWMLYTNDDEYANDAWGSCEYQETVYHSASVGAEILPVKDGYVYIWCLQSF